MVSIQKKVEEYINQRNSIKDCFKKGVINYSALSRKILTQLKLKEQNFDAVLIACRRYADQLKHRDNENKVMRLLRKSQIKTRSKVCRFVFHNNTEITVPPLHLIQGDKSITAIFTKDQYILIKENYENDILDERKDLAEIIITSPQEVDTTLGITSFLSNILSDAGINFLTVLGSYREDVFILENKDLAKALEILNKII
ncbi:ACT domain-containing protein [Candidatus Woesearchaeota archaeon]|jgi:hypothetical protein|nr:ACT domain-containing protein [Candidatus Woesearchaeota archaeon]MBT7403114.1 ACT domain-containing protein [Candidatus Woesearchaeota archaeon]